MHQLTGWSADLRVSTDGDGVVSMVGVAALRMLADRTGLTQAISVILARPGFHPVHDRGRVLTDMACAIAAGHDDAIDELASLLLDEGGPEQIDELLRQLTEAGHDSSAYFLALDIGERGHISVDERADRFIEWLRPRAAAGDLHATAEIAMHLCVSGQIDEAERIYRHLAVTHGHEAAIACLRKLLTDHGRPDEAELLKRHGLTAAGRTAQAWSSLSPSRMLTLRKRGVRAKRRSSNTTS